ncbi:outer membrane protein transport protein [Akkermansiaceae bacterium]|nr:outer membrane protein transport protein [Akkermansiaceae bacterium]
MLHPLKTHCLSLACLAPGLAAAAGYYLPNQDAFATARGNAFVATADSPAAVFYNPAGLTQLESPQAHVGLYSIVLGNQAEVGGMKSDAKTELQAAPHVFYSRPLSDRLTFGFGLNSPFGLGTDWGRNTNFSPVVTEARLTYLSTTAAVAYEVSETFSVGGSISVNYADLLLEQGLGPPGSFLRFEGSDIGLSAALGVRWEPHDRHAFGAMLSSGSTFDLDGKTVSSILPGDNSSEFEFLTPARAAIGYSYRPAPGWNIEANVEWLDWDSLDSLNLSSASVGGNLPVAFNWKSSFIYEIGASYTTESGHVFAAGYDFNMNAQPDRDFTPGVSDADRHWFNLGYGRRQEDSFWMLAYQFGYSNRTVDGAANPLVNGKYESRHNALVFTWRKDF